MSKHEPEDLSEKSSTKSDTESTESKISIIAEPEKSLTYLRIIRNILIKTLPISSSTIIITAGKFLRSYLLSHLKKEDFAGADLASGVQSFVFSPINSLVRQNAVFAAQCYGRIKSLTSEENSNISLIQENQAEIGKILRQAWVLSLAGGALIAGIVPLAKPIFLFFGTPKSVADSAQSYLLPFMLSIPANMAVFSNQRFLVSVDLEKWLVAFTIFSVASGMLLDWFLISTFNNIQGAAWSSVAQAFLNLASYLLFFAIKKDLKPYKIFSLFEKKDFLYLKNMLKQSWPYAIRDIILSGRVLYLRTLMSRFGESALIMDQVARVFLTTIEENIPQPIYSASNRLIAQSLGIANRTKEKIHFISTRKYGNTNLLSSTLLFAGLALPTLFFYKQLSSIFMDEKDIENNSQLLLYIFIAEASKYLFNVTRRSLTSNLSALEDTFLPSAMSILSTLFITIPLAMLFTNVFDFGQPSIYLAVAIGLLIDAVPVAAKWHVETKKMIDKEEYDPEVSSSNAWFEHKFSYIKSGYNSFCSFFRKNNSQPRTPEAVVEIQETDSENEGLINS